MLVSMVSKVQHTSGVCVSMLCNTDQLSTTQDTVLPVSGVGQLLYSSLSAEIEPSHPRVTTVRVSSQLGNNFVYLSRLNCGFPELGRALEL